MGLYIWTVSWTNDDPKRLPYSATLPHHAFHSYGSLNSCVPSKVDPQKLINRSAGIEMKPTTERVTIRRTIGTYTMGTARLTTLSVQLAIQ